MTIASDLDRGPKVPNLDTIPLEEVTAAQAAEIIGTDRRQITRMVQREQLAPTRKLPGATGAYLFARADVERIAAERAA